MRAKPRQGECRGFSGSRLVSGGRHRQPYFWYRIIYRLTTVKIERAASCPTRLLLRAANGEHSPAKPEGSTHATTPPFGFHLFDRLGCAGGLPAIGTPLRQRARSCETPSSNRPRVGPRRSPSSSSDAPRSRTAADVPCSRTSGSSRLSYGA